MSARCRQGRLHRFGQHCFGHDGARLLQQRLDEIALPMVYGRGHGAVRRPLELSADLRGREGALVRRTALFRGCKGVSVGNELGPMARGVQGLGEGAVGLVHIAAVVHVADGREGAGQHQGGQAHVQGDELRPQAAQQRRGRRAGGPGGRSGRDRRGAATAGLRCGAPAGCGGRGVAGGFRCGGGAGCGRCLRGRVGHRRGGGVVADHWAPSAKR